MARKTKRTFRWGIRGDDRTVHAGGCDHKHRSIGAAAQCLRRATRQICSPGMWIEGSEVMTSDGGRLSEIESYEVADA